MKRGFVLGGLVLALVSLPMMQVQAGVEAKCKACHKFDAKHSMGPGLAGVFGRKAGGTDFAKYGDALKSGSWVWDEEHLREYLGDSKAAVKKFTGDDGAKTKMPPMKLKGDKLDEIITFLKGLK
jgi:cytochrome c